MYTLYTYNILYNMNINKYFYLSSNAGFPSILWTGKPSDEAFFGLNFLNISITKLY